MTQKITAIFGIAVLAAVLLGGLTFSQAVFAGGPGGPPGKVTLCHVDQETGEEITISVGAPAVPAHLAHGDTLGPCDDGPSTCEEDCDEDFNICLGQCPNGLDGASELCPGICQSLKNTCLLTCDDD